MESKEINKIFSEYIRNSMERKGVNQSELARRTKVSQERISRIVNNESRISLQDFVILCSFLEPEITKELLSKIEKSRYIMLTSLKENLLNPILMAQYMQGLPCGDFSGSTYWENLLFSYTSKIQNKPQLDSTSTRRSAESIPDLYQFIGVRKSAPVAKNCNIHCHFFQLQPELAQKNRIDGLC